MAFIPKRKSHELSGIVTNLLLFVLNWFVIN